MTDSKKTVEERLTALEEKIAMAEKYNAHLFVDSEAEARKAEKAAEKAALKEAKELEKDGVITGD